MKYRSKPIYVDAIQWMGDNDQEVLDLIKTQHTIRSTNRGQAIINTKYKEGVEILEVQTEESSITIPFGRFVVIDKNKELLIIKPETFKNSFERIWNDNDFSI